MRVSLLDRLLLTASVAITVAAIPMLLLRGDASAREEVPEYCEAGSSNACFSKAISGQGTFFDQYYCNIAHYDEDCVTCFAAELDTCYPPGKGGGSAPGYKKMKNGS